MGILEEGFGGVLVEVDVAKFVDGEQVVAALAGHDAGELVVVAGFGKPVASTAADLAATTSPGPTGRRPYREGA